MRIVAISDSTDRVSKDFYRRLRNMFIVVSRTRLAQIFEFPRLVISGFRVRLRFDASHFTKCLKANVWTRASTMKDQIIGIRIRRHDTFNVSVYDAIHRSIKCLARFNATIEDPAPPGLLLDFTVGRLVLP